MSDFGVLHNRKRGWIALIHSVVFLGAAMHGFLSPKAGIVNGPRAFADVVLTGIYLVVTSILAWLISASRCTRERAYFALCSCSASLGLLRTVFGDASMPVAQYMRVILLTCAVLIGTAIVRSFSRPALQPGE